MNGVSLFAGVGGFDLAMERNGIDVVASVEIDKAARGVLERRFPHTQHFSDIKDVTGEQLRDAGFIPDSGVLVGGFPCQDLSVAGKRAGLVGRRSGLYWEIVRLIDELSPRWVVLENVPGLLSTGHYDDCADDKCGACWPGRDFGTVLGSLVERGYGVAYRILDAQHFGVPQRRRRVFIVGCLGDDGRAPFEVLALGQGMSGDTEKGAEAGQDVTDGVANSLGTRRRHDLEMETYVTHTLTGNGFDASEDGTGRGTPIVAFHQKQNPISGEMSPALGASSSGMGVMIKPFVKIIRSGARDDEGELPAEVWAERHTAPTMNAMDNTGDSRATVLIPILEATARQGQSTEGSAGIGNNGDPMFTLQSTQQHGVFALQDGRDIEKAQNGLGIGDEIAFTLDRTGAQSVASAAAVRRLTPMECERLQGFPDGWTAEGINGPQSDSARYRQMGNAVAVPVVEWIFRNLKKLEPRE